MESGWIDNDHQDEVQHLHQFSESVKLNRYTLTYTNPEYEQYFRRYYIDTYNNTIIKGIAEFIVFFILWLILQLIHLWTINSSNNIKLISIIIEILAILISMLFLILVKKKQLIMSSSNTYYMNMIISINVIIFSIANILWAYYNSELMTSLHILTMMVILSTISPLLKATFVAQLIISILCTISYLLIAYLNTGNNFKWQLSFILIVCNILFALESYHQEFNVRSGFMAGVKRLYEESQSRELLERMLPNDVINKLMAHVPYIYKKYDEVSVLFSNVYEFDKLTALFEPLHLVRYLNYLFSQFDTITDLHGVYKCETIGSVYVVVSGCPLDYRTPYHAHALASTALDMQLIMQACQVEGLPEILLRIGIHTGPIITGIVGSKYPRYRLTGDTVNVASRMSTTCNGSDIQISSITHRLLRDIPAGFIMEPRGTIFIKGKGNLNTYILIFGPCVFALEGRQIMVNEPLFQAQYEEINDILHFDDVRTHDTYHGARLSPSYNKLNHQIKHHHEEAMNHQAGGNPNNYNNHNIDIIYSSNETNHRQLGNNAEPNWNKFSSILSSSDDDDSDTLNNLKASKKGITTSTSSSYKNLIKSPLSNNSNNQQPNYSLSPALSHNSNHTPVLAGRLLSLGNLVDLSIKGNTTPADHQQGKYSGIFRSRRNSLAIKEDDDDDTDLALINSTEHQLDQELLEIEKLERLEKRSVDGFRLSLSSNTLSNSLTNTNNPPITPLSTTNSRHGSRHGSPFTFKYSRRLHGSNSTNNDEYVLEQQQSKKEDQQNKKPTDDVNDDVNDNANANANDDDDDISPSSVVNTAAIQPNTQSNRTEKRMMMMMY